jgi:SHS2 domain-containing protein
MIETGLTPQTKVFAQNQYFKVDKKVIIMEKFKFVDITTADVAFEAYGKDLSELFANAALAMFEVMVNTKQIKPIVKRRVTVDGNDLQSLLFNWLNELLVFVDGENLAFSEFEVKVSEKNLKLKAICKGEEMNRERHETRTHVKAATMHKMEIEKNKIWKAKVILDI